MKKPMNLLRVTEVLVPIIVTILLIILGGVNFQITDFFAITPAFIVICVFYWRLYNPAYMRKMWVFLLGIFQDMLYGNILGVTSLLLLLLVQIIKTHRQDIIHQPFWVRWMIFSILMLFFTLGAWLINNMIQWQFVFNSAILYQYFITILIYPAMHKAFSILGDNHAA